MDQSGIVFDIQPFSTHDGPGIRTTVFLKGCNNRCAWCHNPESLSLKPQLRFFASRCIGCGACVKACPNNAFRDGRFDFTRCLSCGRCAEVCPTGARELCGRVMTSGQVYARVAKDLPFYRNSGGGVTFSGGEPLLQADFVAETAHLCKENGIGTGIQTALNVPYSEVEKVLPDMDFVMCDFKTADEETHQRYVGVSQKRILENLDRLSLEKVRLIVRTLIVPGVTDSIDAVCRIAERIRNYPNLDHYFLLRYHSLGMSKLETIGACEGIRAFETPTDEKMEELTLAAKRILPTVKHN